MVAVETSPGTHAFRKAGKDQEHLADFLLGFRFHSGPLLEPERGTFLLNALPASLAIPPHGGPCLELLLPVGASWEMSSANIALVGGALPAPDT